MEENQSLNLLVAEMREQLDIHKARAAMFAALAKAQGGFLPIEKNKSVTIRPKEKAPYSFDYADLEELIKKTRPALSANGLAVVQIIQDGRLITQLLHAEGGILESSTAVPRADGDPKSHGALLTYLRRYAYSALLCLAADDDLDEDGQEAGSQGGVEHKPTERREPKPKAEPRAEQSQATGDDPASPAGVKWVKDKLAADQTGKVAEILERLGIKALDQLTKAQFIKAKEEIMKC